jgi:hypothetical protein
MFDLLSSRSFSEVGSLGEGGCSYSFAWSAWFDAKKVTPSFIPARLAAGLSPAEASTSAKATADRRRRRALFFKAVHTAGDSFCLLPQVFHKKTHDNCFPFKELGDYHPFVND